MRNEANKQEPHGDTPCYQTGVLRTNCIDCLDRTNVAQYAYGLAALGRQLHAMGLTHVSKIHPDSSIASALMEMYQGMGDALAHQYGGSAAHNTVSEIFFSTPSVFFYLTLGSSKFQLTGVRLKRTDVVYVKLRIVISHL